MTSQASAMAWSMGWARIIHAEMIARLNAVQFVAEVRMGPVIIEKDASILYARSPIQQARP